MSDDGSWEGVFASIVIGVGSAMVGSALGFGYVGSIGLAMCLIGMAMLVNDG